MADHIGFLYYKEYFEGLKFDLKNAKPSLSAKPISKEIFRADLNAYNRSYLENIEHSFYLKTLYPGLLVGSGYNHELGGKELEDELKLGFYFDATSGLPTIPGSSIKGMLRAACEQVGGGYILSLLEEIQEGKDKGLKIAAQAFLESDKDKILKGNQDYSPFVMNVFEGKKSEEEYLPIYERDIFFDAVPCSTGNENGVFLGNDYITHHEKPLENPNPVQFMKVLSDVTFKFHFKLTDHLMKADLKKELFKRMLLDLGVGAKTNTGYGQWTEGKEVSTKVRKISSFDPKEYVHIEDYHDYPRNTNIEDAEIIKEIEGHFIFRIGKKDQIVKKIDNMISKFEENAEKRKKKNKSHIYKTLAVGDKVKIVIKDIYKNSFTVQATWLK